MPFKDMREFIELLRERGELKVCKKEVDRRIEIAKVTDKSSKVGGPAILFENVKGFETSVVTGLFGTLERGTLALGSTKYDGFSWQRNCGHHSGMGGYEMDSQTRENQSVTFTPAVAEPAEISWRNLLRPIPRWCL